MASRIDAISSIDSSKDDWIILARVVRMWSVFMGHKSRVQTSIEMLLADKEGSKIHASIRKHFIKKYEPLLKEDCVYSIKGFSVTGNGGEYQAANHEFKLNFHGNTKVALLANNMVPPPANDFASFSEIVGGFRDSSYLIDVLGILASVGEERSIDRSSGVTKMNVIELENTGMKITCSLWGLFVDQLNTFLASTGPGTVVIAMFGVKIKEFQGKITLQNTMHSTRMVFNPQILEAIELRGSLSGNVPYSQGVSHLTKSGLPNVEEDFLTLTKGITISQLKDLSDDTIGFFIVYGTIHHLIDPLDWWYLACKCHKAVYPESLAYYCSSCDNHVLQPTARYKIKVNVVDDTGSATFILFDRSASVLFNQECSSIVNSLGKATKDSDCPAVISGLVDKDFLFKVDVKGYTSSSFETTYIVKRLTNDPSIINKFKEMNGIKDVSCSMLPVNSPKVPAHVPAGTSISKAPITLVEDSSQAQFHEPNENDVVAPLSTLSHMEGVGYSGTKIPMVDVDYLTDIQSASKHIAVDCGEMLKEKSKPKLLKRIKIEKE